MKKLFRVAMLMAFGALLVGHLTSGSLSAGTWAATTNLKFSADVALPGMVLPAGEYIFELSDPFTGRSVVRVLNRQRSHSFAQLLTRRTSPRSTALEGRVTLGESRSGAPRPIVAWYPAGYSSGYEFIY